MHDVKHLTMEELAVGLEVIRQSPLDEGLLKLIVRRPAVEQREVLEEAELDPARGLIGDCWAARPSSRTPDRSAHPEMRLNIMNARVIALIAPDPNRWQLAGDQLYLDLDLSSRNLQPDTRLALGSAIIQITAIPHTGCRKFVSRFGLDAMKFVNSPLGRRLNLRGINARVVRSGVIRVGDLAKKL